MTKRKREEAKRLRLPDTRPSVTHKVEIMGDYGEVDLFLTAGYYPDTGEIGEIFMNIGKQGSTLKGLVDGWAIMLSLALQCSIDLDGIIDKFKGSAFEPSGRTTNPEIPTCSSLLDYAVKWIEINRKRE